MGDREARHGEAIKLQTDVFGRRRLLGETDSGAPLGRRPDWSRRKSAAAVGADVVEMGFDAIGAEGALVGADARVGRRRRQILVAVFAVGSELEHGCRSIPFIR